MNYRLVSALALTLVACVSTQQAVAQSAPHPYAMQHLAPPPAPAYAPSWFVNLPNDTAEMVFAAGTATSTDEQMAYDKARMSAERKLVEQMSSRIRTQTRSYKADRGEAMIENYEQVTRKNANGELIGAQRVDSQATFDGRYYKVYVLLRLPLGDANIQRREVRAEKIQREADLRSERAHQELDANEAQTRQERAIDDAQLKKEVGPQAKAEPQSQVAPVTVPTENGEVKLMQVDNEEYKRRRDEALAKPGAVIGQSVMR